jgi:hypothetical protein
MIGLLSLPNPPCIMIVTFQSDKTATDNAAVEVEDCLPCYMTGKYSHCNPEGTVHQDGMLRVRWRTRLLSRFGLH